VKDFFSFDKMITPLLINIFFWIGIAVSLLTGLGIIVSGLASPFGGGAMVFTGLMILVLGPLAARVYCELLIVIFKIHDSLQVIKTHITSHEDKS